MLNIRLEQSQDFRAVEELTREAFWNEHVEACDEHYLVHIMRQDAAFIKQLAFVAEQDGLLVGNIMYMQAQIECDDGTIVPVISFGPLSVLPQAQGLGVGKALIAHTARLSHELGHKAIMIYGDPDYYSKSGFVAAERYGIGTANNQYAVPLLALELCPEGLSGCAGRFMEPAIFNMDSKAVAEFDMQFPYKERKSGLPSQLRFQQLVRMRKPRESFTD